MKADMHMEGTSFSSELLLYAPVRKMQQHQTSKAMLIEDKAICQTEALFQ